MRAPLLAAAAIVLLAAALPAQQGNARVIMGATTAQPVARVYRQALDVMRGVGYTPDILLLDQAIGANHPVVLGKGKSPTVAQLMFERKGDSTSIRAEAVAVDASGERRCETEECTAHAVEATIELLSRLVEALDSLRPEPRTAADSLREAKAYGYAPERPIRVGGGAESGVANERAYLASLRGPGGEAVSFLRIGSCCPFAPPGGAEKTARIDAYEVTYAGLAKPVVLYVDIYAAADGGLVPAGFTRAPDIPAPST